LNDEITPLLPTGVGERYSQSISNLGHAALSRRYTPPFNESDELNKLTQGVYGNLHVKIPRLTKYEKIFHQTMGMYVGKFLEIENICASLVWLAEN
jgi:hypothetical protein